LLLTVILDFTGSRLFPIIYQNPEIIPQDTGLLRFVVNLLALQGTWGSRIQFGSNSPLWSIGYEFSFYLMFGLYVYARENPNRTRVLFIGGIVCIAAKGPLLVGYALIWLMGLTSHQFASRYKIRLSFLSFSLAVALMLVCNHYIMLVDIFKLPRFSSDFVFSLTIALFLFFEYPDVKFNGYWKKLLTLNRVMANFSYTLYATHLPVMLLVYAATFNYFLDLKRLNATSLGIIVGLFSVSFAYLFSKISEEKRGGYRIVADELISGLLLRWRCSRAC
jgi:peptidoglycan/LPS O-acetylase OafA/YrhL